MMPYRTYHACFVPSVHLSCNPQKVGKGVGREPKSQTSQHGNLLSATRHLHRAGRKTHTLWCSRDSEAYDEVLMLLPALWLCNLPQGRKPTGSSQRNNSFRARVAWGTPSESVRPGARAFGQLNCTFTCHIKNARNNPSSYTEWRMVGEK